jgi:hypothetical protein
MTDLARTLERELSAAKAECERLKFALVEWEAKERGWSKAVEKDAAELTRLRAENLTVHKMACAAALERDSLRAEVGEKEMQREQASAYASTVTAENVALRAEVERLKGALALGQPCDVETWRRVLDQP